MNYVDQSKYIDCELDIVYYNTLCGKINYSPSFETQFNIYYFKREGAISIDRLISYLQQYLSVDNEAKTVNFYIKKYEKFFKNMLVIKPYLVYNTIYYYLISKGFQNAHIYSIEFINLFNELPKLKINTLTTDEDNKMGVIKGIIRTKTNALPIIKIGVYICRFCRREYTTYHEYNYYVVPSCESKGCKKGIVLDETRSTYIDVVKIDIQESQQDLAPGEQPKIISAFCELRKKIDLAPGKEAQLAVIVKKHNTDTKGTPFYQRYFDIFAKSELKTDSKKNSVLKEQIERNIKEDYEGFQNRLLQILTPIGLPIYLKRAILLQLIGGVRKNTGTSILRGDIHILLIGSPGVGKSQLLKNCAKISKGVFVSGVSTTGVGLTAAVVKDNLLAGKWGVEAGAFVFADNRYLALDELDKVPTNQIVGVHEAMEQQSISIAKAGIVMTLNTRCPVLAAANPVHGEFIPEAPLHKQINLLPTILNRFDLVFLVDSKNIEINSLGESIFNAQLNAVSQSEFEMFEVYLLLCKQYKPVLNKTIERRISNLYSKMKLQSSILITARQFECLIRLVEARARSRLSEIITEEDYTYVQQIVLETLYRQKIDSHYIESSIPKKEFEYRRQILALIKESQTITHADIIQKFNSVDAQLIENLLIKMVKIQILYKPTHNTYALV